MDEGVVKRVLLHICCGPCSIYPFATLHAQGYTLECFFYNPNIEPLDEYERRREAAVAFQKQCSATVHYVEYDHALYRARRAQSPAGEFRCRSCFALRLEKTATFANNNGFDSFTTTLLVSPYQDQQIINELGHALSQNAGAKFLSYDFRSGFRQGQAQAKDLQLYRQNYCGCLDSLQERNQQIEKKKARVGL